MKRYKVEFTISQQGAIQDVVREHDVEFSQDCDGMFTAHIYAPGADDQGVLQRVKDLQEWNLATLKSNVERYLKRDAVDLLYVRVQAQGE